MTASAPANSPESPVESRSSFPSLEHPAVNLQGERVRYLLERRLARAVETLTRDAVGKSLDVHVIQPTMEPDQTFRPSSRDNSFCRLVYSTKEGAEKCSQCYRARLDQARESGQYIRYNCHAGLTNILIPVHVNSTLVGGLVMGRILLRQPSAADKKGIAQRLSSLSIKSSAAQKAIADVPVMDEADIELAALVARNLVQTESPLLLESQVFNPVIEKHSEMVLTTPTATTGPPSSATYGSYLHHQRICQRVIEIIEHQFASPITLGKLANGFKITPSYLATIFRKNMGITINDYLLRVRVQKAQGFLQRTDVNIKEVAYRVGFSDSNYFACVFKKLTGLTPTQWRAQMDEQMLRVRPLVPIDNGLLKDSLAPPSSTTSQSDETRADI